MKRGTLMADTPRPTAVAAPEQQQTPSTQERPAKAKSREGKRNVTAYIDETAHRQLRLLAADEDADMQALLIEGLNEVFAKRGLPWIA